MWCLTMHTATPSVQPSCYVTDHWLIGVLSVCPVMSHLWLQIASYTQIKPQSVKCLPGIRRGVGGVGQSAHASGVGDL